MTIKYLSTYDGIGYRSMDQEYMEGLESLHEGMQQMRSMQSQELHYFADFMENSEGVYELQGSSPRQGLTATRQDIMWLYWAVPEDGGYVLGDLAYCLLVGPKGGIKVEKA